MDLTPNYGLGKPLPGENYDVGVWNTNSDIVDAAIKARADAITALEGRFISGTPPRVKMQQTGVQTTANGVSEVLLLAAAATVYDTDTMTSDKANNNLQVKHAGWYIVSVRLVWTASNVGDRSLAIKKNGANVWEDQRKPPLAGVCTQTVISEPMSLALNDKISVDIQQTSGGTLTLTTTGPGYSSLSMHLLPQ